MKLKFNNKVVEISPIKKTNFFTRISGLMFSRREKASALFFEFKKPVRISIHSFFVFFPFLAIWLDETGNIVDKKVVMPWRFSVIPEKKFVKLVEIPFSRRYKNILNILVGERFKY